VAHWPRVWLLAAPGDPPPPAVSLCQVQCQCDCVRLGLGRRATGGEGEADGPHLGPGTVSNGRGAAMAHPSAGARATVASVAEDHDVVVPGRGGDDPVMGRRLDGRAGLDGGNCAEAQPVPAALATSVGNPARVALGGVSTARRGDPRVSLDRPDASSVEGVEGKERFSRQDVPRGSERPRLWRPIVVRLIDPAADAPIGPFPAPPQVPYGAYGSAVIVPVVRKGVILL